MIIVCLFLFTKNYLILGLFFFLSCFGPDSLLCLLVVYVLVALFFQKSPNSSTLKIWSLLYWPSSMSFVKSAMKLSTVVLSTESASSVLEMLLTFALTQPVKPTLTSFKLDWLSQLWRNVVHQLSGHYTNQFFINNWTITHLIINPQHQLLFHYFHQWSVFACECLVNIFN